MQKINLQTGAYYAKRENLFSRHSFCRNEEMEEDLASPQVAKHKHAFLKHDLIDIEAETAGVART